MLRDLLFPAEQWTQSSLKFYSCSLENLSSCSVHLPTVSPNRHTSHTCYAALMMCLRNSMTLPPPHDPLSIYTPASGNQVHSGTWDLGTSRCSLKKKKISLLNWWASYPMFWAQNSKWRRNRSKIFWLNVIWKSCQGVMNNALESPWFSLCGSLRMWSVPRGFHTAQS